jgi:hypothetical protein
MRTRQRGVAAKPATKKGGCRTPPYSLCVLSAPWMQALPNAPAPTRSSPTPSEAQGKMGNGVRGRDARCHVSESGYGGSWWTATRARPEETSLSTPAEPLRVLAPRIDPLKVLKASRAPASPVSAAHGAVSCIQRPFPSKTRTDSGMHAPGRHSKRMRTQMHLRPRRAHGEPRDAGPGMSRRATARQDRPPPAAPSAGYWNARARRRQNGDGDTRAPERDCTRRPLPTKESCLPLLPPPLSPPPPPPPPCESESI